MWDAGVYGAGDLQEDGSREASVSNKGRRFRGNLGKCWTAANYAWKCSDIWAIGVITYFLLCGYTPFDRDSNLEEMQAILVADYKYEPYEYWKEVSPQGKNLNNPRD